MLFFSVVAFSAVTYWQQHSLWQGIWTRLQTDSSRWMQSYSHMTHQAVSADHTPQRDTAQAQQVFLEWVLRSGNWDYIRWEHSGERWTAGDLPSPPYYEHIWKGDHSQAVFFMSHASADRLLAQYENPIWFLGFFHTLIVSIVIMGLFRWMVTRHLSRIAQYAQAMNLQTLDKPLYLPRTAFFEPSHGDELSEVVSAFNALRVFVQQELYTRMQAEKSIKELNEHLEEKIQQRTAQMEYANQELKNTLAQLQGTQKQLVENEKMAALGGLVAGIAHEINTPVGIGVTAASHLKQMTDEIEKLLVSKLLKKSDLETYVRASVDSSEILLKNLNRAAALVQSFKQVAVDQTAQEKRNFVLRAYIDEILISLSPKLKRVKHEVEVQCDSELSIYSDPGIFSHILTNLIVNSVVHAYDEGTAGRMRIVVQKIPERQALQLHYADDGKGIPAEHLQKIFDPFFTTKRGSGGTGLGLHILFNMVTQGLKGTVECRSELGKGTDFFIEFPLETA